MASSIFLYDIIGNNGPNISSVITALLTSGLSIIVGSIHFSFKSYYPPKITLPLWFSKYFNILLVWNSLTILFIHPDFFTSLP